MIFNKVHMIEQNVTSKASHILYKPTNYMIINKLWFVSW